MAKSQITQFYEEQVLPRVFDNVPKLFPEYQFVQKHTTKGRKWSSPLHFDQTPSTKGKREKTVIPEGYKGAIENGGTSMSYIDLYMLNHPNLKPYEAIYEMAHICGVPKPEFDPKLLGEMDRTFSQYRKLGAFAEECRKALLSGAPEVQNVRSYCTGRSLSEIEINRGRLGYFHKGCALQPFFDDALTNEGRPVYVDDRYDYLTIPVIAENRVVSIIFRAVTDDPKVRKYLYPSNDQTKSRGYLYNMPVVPHSDSLILVEGQIDALTITCSNAYANGGNCPEMDCMALGGSSITPEAVRRIARLGYRNVHVLIDRDTEGYNYEFFYAIRGQFREFAPNINIEMMSFPDSVTKLFDNDAEN